MDEIVRTVLVVVLLAIGVIGAFVAAGQVSPTARVTAYAGFWAGVFLVGLLQITVADVRPPVVDVLARLPRQWAVVIGVLAGILLITSFLMSRGGRAVGGVLMAQTAVAGGGMLLYFRAEPTRGAIALMTVGAALGVCLTCFVPRRYVAVHEERRIRRVDDRRRALARSVQTGIRRHSPESVEVITKVYLRERRRQRWRLVRTSFRRRRDDEEPW